MADYQAAAALSECPPGKMRAVKVGGRSILLANVEGQIYAVDELCTHEDSSLALGCLKGDKVKCSLHGSRFCLKTGQPQEEPATEPLRTYPVKIDAEQIWVLVE